MHMLSCISTIKLFLFHVIMLLVKANFSLFSYSIFLVLEIKTLKLYVRSGVDFRERSLLLFLFIISVKMFEDLYNYPAMINTALTDGLLLKKSD